MKKGRTGFNIIKKGNEWHGDNFKKRGGYTTEQKVV